jgi:hypothetical protein
VISVGQAVCIGGMLGVPLTQCRATDRGQGRTFFALTTAGEPVVLKWLSDPSDGAARHLHYAESLRARGYPAPRTVAHGPVLDGYGVIQERLPGTPPLDRMSSSVLQELLDAVELQSGAGALDGMPGTARSGAVVLAHVVHDDSKGWWRAARHAGEEISELYTALGHWVRAVPLPEPRLDLVHFDLNTANVLTAGDRLTGIVDIDQLSVGDRGTDLTSLAFHLERHRLHGAPLPSPDVVDLLTDRVLRLSGRSGWRHAVAYYALHQLQWTKPTEPRVRLGVTASIVRRMMAQPD